MSNGPGWIGVDLDGTLAHYERWEGPEHIGAPIEAMVKRVQGWLADGRPVKVFTARVSHDGTPRRESEAILARRAIQAWCLKHIGLALEVTNVKDYAMVELWDDRAVQVEMNKGTPVGYSTRGN